jgi:uncharacterized protein YeeX (DUF496 family)
MNDDIIIQSLFQQRIKLKQRFRAKAIMHQEYKKLEKRIRSEKQRLRDMLLADIQERYKREEPVRVIERQLSGVKIDKQPKVMSYFLEDTLPEQRRLIEAIILAPPGATLDEEVKRRNNAINTVAAYYKIEEGQTPKRVRSSLGQAKARAIKQEEDMQSLQIEL